MATIKTIFKGESFSILFAFPASYEMSRIEEHKIFIGEQEYAGVIEGQGIILKLKSSDTEKLYGIKKLRLWIDDSILGVRKPDLGDLAISKTQATPFNESVSEVYDVIINVDITVTSINGGDILFNYVKGDKGDTGNYGVVEFVVNENMELEQHTLAGDPLDFAIVDGDLVLNEAGETVNLGTVANKDTYSLDEKIIGEWVDGKPIYRKVIDLSLQNYDGANFIITHNLGIEQYIRYYLICPLNHNEQMAFVLNASNVFEFGVEIINTGYYLILEYTKL